VDDDGSLYAVDDADLVDVAAWLAPMIIVKPSSSAKTADWVLVCVADVLVTDAVPASAGRDDHLPALTS